MTFKGASDLSGLWASPGVRRSIVDVSPGRRAQPLDIVAGRADVAEEFGCELAIDLQDESRVLEVRSLARWFEEITNWHKAFVTNEPTEAVNNLIKRIKRIGLGFRSFDHYRIRVLPYAGNPNSSLLATITPR